MVIGQPQESGPPREVAWSVPYAVAQFGLVVPPRFTRRPAPWLIFRGKRVGIVAGTVAISEKDHAVVQASSRAKSFWTRLPGRGARRRVSGRRFRRLVPARASAARLAARCLTMSHASAGTWPWRCGPRMHSSWWKSTAAWLSLPSRESCGRSTTGRECRFIRLFRELPRREAPATPGAAFASEAN